MRRRFAANAISASLPKQPSRASLAMLALSLGRNASQASQRDSRLEQQCGAAKRNDRFYQKGLRCFCRTAAASLTTAPSQPDLTSEGVPVAYPRCDTGKEQLSHFSRIWDAATKAISLHLRHRFLGLSVSPSVVNGSLGVEVEVQGWEWSLSPHGPLWQLHFIIYGP